MLKDTANTYDAYAPFYGYDRANRVTIIAGRELTVPPYRLERSGAESPKTILMAWKRAR